MESYKTIEHTADIGIEVKGPDLAGLFVNAARAMTDMMVESREVGERTVAKVSIKAGMKEELLVKWLEEILYYFEMKDKIAVGFKIDKITDTDINAEVSFIPFSPTIQRPKYQIKAVTYHNLAIREEGGYFSATIIFDI